MDQELSSKFDSISSSLDILKDAITEIRDRNKNLTDRVEKLECNKENFAQRRDFNPFDCADDKLYPGPAGINYDQCTAVIPDSDSDIQAEFAAIKEALQKVKLPADLILHDSKQGIKREDQPNLQVLAKCARYAEVSMKLLSTVNVDNISEEDIKHLCVIQVAQLRYLQDEYASLIVQGKFNKQTSQMFRALQKNTSGLSTSALQNLKIAADITSSASTQSQPALNSSNAGFQNSRGRGRSGFWRPVPARGNFRRNQDIFDHFAQ